MKLKEVRITNYQCVEDSEPFTIGQLTALVGKNESGKTSLLKALERLNPVSGAKFDAVQEYPRRRYSDYQDGRDAGADADTVITTKWELEPADQKVLEDVLWDRAEKLKEVSIQKDYNNIVWLNCEFDERALVQTLLRDANLDEKLFGSASEATSIEELLKLLTDNGDDAAEKTALIAKINSSFPGADVIAVIEKRLVDRIPKFLYFPSYHHIPGRVSLNQLNEKRTANPPQLKTPAHYFLALIELAGITLEKLVGVGKFEEYLAKLEAVSLRMTDTIFKYWSQNKHLKVQFRVDEGRKDDEPPFNAGHVFRTQIENTRHGATVNFDSRSAGFVWFFSFLVWFSRVNKKYGDNIFILLDEPGLNLHARAQADLLRFIREKLCPSHSVVYTTHSPFMIDVDDLGSVRTVEDVTSAQGELLGTKVGEKILSTDADTLFPIQTALGYDLTQSFFVGKHTLVVEGPSEYFYFKAISRILREKGRVSMDQRWVIAPVEGLKKASTFVALFAANHLHVAGFTDYGQGDKTEV